MSQFFTSGGQRIGASASSSVLPMNIQGRFPLGLTGYQESPPGPTVQEDPLEKEMAIHFSILTWRIPWSEEPGGLQSMRSQGVGHE